MNSPGRSLRIDEMLKEWTTSGRKISLEDLGAVQQDVTDVIARRMTPLILSISKEVSHQLSEH